MLERPEQEVLHIVELEVLHIVEQELEVLHIEVGQEQLVLVTALQMLAVVGVGVVVVVAEVECIDLAAVELIYEITE